MCHIADLPSINVVSGRRRPVNQLFTLYASSPLAIDHFRAGPRILNSRPDDITSAPSLAIFRQTGKKTSISQSYPDNILRSVLRVVLGG